MIFVWRHFLCHSKASTMYVIDLEWRNLFLCLKSSTYYYCLFFFSFCVRDVVIGKICEIVFIPKIACMNMFRYRLMSNRHSQLGYNADKVLVFFSPFCVITIGVYVLNLCLTQGHCGENWCWIWDEFLILNIAKICKKKTIKLYDKIFLWWDWSQEANKKFSQQNQWQNMKNSTHNLWKLISSSSSLNVLLSDIFFFASIISFHQYTRSPQRLPWEAIN